MRSERSAGLFAQAMTQNFPVVGIVQEVLRCYAFDSSPNESGGHLHPERSVSASGPKEPTRRAEIASVILLEPMVSMPAWF